MRHMPTRVHAARLVAASVMNGATLDGRGRPTAVGARPSLSCVMRRAGRKEVLTCPRDHGGSGWVSQSPSSDANQSPFQLGPEGRKTREEDAG
jgi:hypothetical protein